MGSVSRQHPPVATRRSLSRRRQCRLGGLDRGGDLAVRPKRNHGSFNISVGRHQLADPLQIPAKFYLAHSGGRVVGLVDETVRL